MTIEEAQSQVRLAYVGGGPGTLISGLVWLAAALTQRQRGTAMAFTVLFVGGMTIFVLTTAICRLLFKRPPEQAHALGRVALESTFCMFGGLIAAWLLLPLRPAYVFPLAALAVGTHYFPFRTAYGNPLFWALGGLITVIGCLAIFAGWFPAEYTALATGWLRSSSV